MSKEIIEMMRGEHKSLLCIDKNNLKVYMQFQEDSGERLVKYLGSIPDYIINYQNIYFFDIDYAPNLVEALCEETKEKVDLPINVWKKLKNDALKFIEN